MKILFFAFLALLVLVFAGCSSNEGKAQNLLETARFEEQQNNIEHAQKLYGEILEKYPKTSAAEQVRNQKNKKPQTGPLIP